MSIFTIESCHSTWVFDTEGQRFRRVLRGMGTGDPAVTEWRPYYALEIDWESDSFLVALNPEGTRLLRSWQHEAGCEQCTDRRTGPVPLQGALRRSAPVPSPSPGGTGAA